MSKPINIEWVSWNKIVNTHYLPILKDQSRNVILYGGRSSGKSNFVAKWLVFKCLNDPYFKCILVREVADTIKESNFKEVRSAIEDLGLSQYFKITENPLQIKCINGNGFIARGMSDITKIKGVHNVSCIWFDEEFPKTIEDYITISTSVRTNKAQNKLIFTINPEVSEADYKDNYFYKMFFASNPTEKTFTNVTSVDIGDKTVDISYTCQHSTYLNNRWTTDAFKAEMLSMQRLNPAKYVTYCLGEWGNKETGGLYHKHFSRSTNTSSSVTYNPDLALFLSVDFNVNPFCSATIWQIDEDKNVLCIDEIASVTPNNNTKGICKEFIRKYANHSSGLFIMGDASGRNKDTRSEQGWNDYKIIETELKHYKPVIKVPSKNPSIVMRGNFINTLFLGEIKGINVIISDKCVHLITDLINLKEDSDGGTKKEKVSENGVTFEKWGHHSDTLAYFLCEALRTEYGIYQHGCEKPKPTLVFKSYNPKTNY
ncbi:MAG: phage terminase, large subunit, family [Bacteroidetes bacterium]|jgi:PBSX family phage terminase large subunit|nr:phage terminase, large subunit, family [Bacteroidota bacterium]